MSLPNRVPPVGFRLPADLKQWLAEQAAKNRRSQNAEVVHRLESMRQQELSKGAPA